MLEVRVDDTGSLRRLEAPPDDPGSDLVRAGCVEEGEVDHPEGGLDDLRQRAGHLLLLELGVGGRLIKVHEIVLKGTAVRYDRGTRGVGLHPLKDGLQKLVLLTLVVIHVHVDGEEDRLGREELQLVEEDDVFSGPNVHAVTDVLAFLHELMNLLVADQVFLPLLLGLGGLGECGGSLLVVVLQRGFHELDVLDAELGGDGGDVSHRVDCVLRVDHVVILKCAHHVDDAVYSLDV
mmetsp:Transcript_20609/g.47086  ORF Transcript_20609/g.47086 Transcript_20609/m.47086 type:complete len:235 (-) Transcript_20609:100-804(-)